MASASKFVARQRQRVGVTGFKCGRPACGVGTTGSGRGGEGQDRCHLGSDTLGLAYGLHSTRRVEYRSFLGHGEPG
jgi:hypothetical protein